MEENPIANEFVFYSEKLNYKSVVGPNGKEFFIEGHITTEDIDLVNDIVTKSCMDDITTQFKDRIIKLDFEHETFRGKSEIEAEANKTRLVLGKAVSVERDSKGVKVNWKLNPTWKKFDQKGSVVMNFKDIWTNVEQGFYDAFSIAYVPTRTSNVSREGKSVRLLDRINMLNVALTGNPINPAASMTAVMAKSLEFMKDNENDYEMVDIEIKDKLTQLETDIKEIKSKYIKRTGRPGHYKYEYPDDNKKLNKKPSNDGPSDNKLHEEAINMIENTNMSEEAIIEDLAAQAGTSLSGGKKIYEQALPDTREGLRPGSGIKKPSDNGPSRGLTSITKQDRKEIIDGYQVATVKLYIQGKVTPSEISDRKKYDQAFREAGVKLENWDELSPGQRIKVMAASNSKLGKVANKIMDQSPKDKKSNIDNLKNEISKIKQVGKLQMVDKKDEQPTDAQTPETPVEEGQEQEVVEEVVEHATEEKSVDLKSEIAILKKDISDLKKENEKLQKIVNKPIIKSKGAENNSEKKDVSVESVFVGPMDMI